MDRSRSSPPKANSSSHCRLWKETSRGRNKAAPMRTSAGRVGDGLARVQRCVVYGQYVTVSSHDPALWDARWIDEADALLLHASTMKAIGRYQLEAAAQSAHAARRLTGSTDWAAIHEIYDALAALTASPV